MNIRQAEPGEFSINLGPSEPLSLAGEKAHALQVVSFTDRPCAVCEQAFKVGDRVAHVILAHVPDDHFPWKMGFAHIDCPLEASG